MHVHMKDRDMTETVFVPIVATGTWQRIRIPLSDFNDLGVNLADLNELKFAFEGRVETSIVYVDDISFSQILVKHTTELYVHNDNTGGNVTFIVRKLTGEEVTRCTVPNNQTIPCDHNNDSSHIFPSGLYETEVHAVCGSKISPINYPPGRQTKRVFCEP